MTGFRLEDRLGRVLTIGSTLSLVFLATGLGMLLLTSLRPAAALLVNAGLVVVLATPVARVVVATLGFAAQKEWRFVVMTLAVLLVLMGSVIAALR